MVASNPYANYKKTEIQTASPAHLVVLLYEGTVKHITKGEALLGDPETFADASTHLLRAMNIITELHGVIRPDASPELAKSLSDIYRYVLDIISQALQERDPEPLAEAAKHMATLGDAWREIASAQSAA